MNLAQQNLKKKTKQNEACQTESVFKRYILLTGKGLTLVASVIEGNIRDKYADAQAARQVMFQWGKFKNERVFTWK